MLGSTSLFGLPSNLKQFHQFPVLSCEFYQYFTPILIFRSIAVFLSDVFSPQVISGEDVISALI